MRTIIFNDPSITGISERGKIMLIRVALCTLAFIAGFTAPPLLAQNINPSTQLRFQAAPVGYSPIFSGTSASGAWQGTTGPGTAGQLMISAGPGAYPIWSNTVSATTSFPCGTVAAPGIYQGTSSGSGLYCIGPNNIGVSINGAQVLNIASNGIGIGGAAPPTGTYLSFNPSLSNAGSIIGFSDRASLTVTASAARAAKMALGASGGITINAAGTVTDVSTLTIFEPNVTLTAGTITTAQTLLIPGAPTEGNANYSMRVASGVSIFQGVLESAGGILQTTTTSPTFTSGQSVWYSSASAGGIFRGSGTASDFALARSDGTVVLSNAASNSSNLVAAGTITSSDVLTTGKFDRSSAATLTLGGTATSLTIGAATVTPASSGTRYLCIDTGGVVASSASACSGT